MSASTTASRPGRRGRRQGHAPRRRGSTAIAARSRWLPYLLLLPAVLLELLIHIVPMLVGIWMSFVELTSSTSRTGRPAPWAGLDNYAVAVDFDAPHRRGPAALVPRHRRLHAARGRPLLASGHGGRRRCCSTPSAAAASLRTMFLVPYALPVYAGVITWSFMLQRDNGLVNHVLRRQPPPDRRPPVLADRRQQPSASMRHRGGLAAAGRSRSSCLMAGLQNIPRDLYEAAAVDGAGDLAPAAPHHAAVAAAGQPGAGAGAVPVDVQRLQHAVRAVRHGQPPERPTSSRSTSTTSFVTWNFGIGSAMSVLLLLFLLRRDRRLPAAHLANAKDADACIEPPSARRWHRRVLPLVPA